MLQVNVRVASEMAKRECANLIFIFTHPDTGKTLRIGEGASVYTDIQKSEELFETLKTSVDEDGEGASLSIPFYLPSMNNTLELNAFLNPNLKYDLQIIIDNQNYYTKVSPEKSDLSNCDDLYGDASKLIVYTINLKLLKPYFVSDYVSTSQIGASYKANFKFGKYYSFPSDLKNYYFSLQNPIVPVAINNTGGTQNGILITIEPTTVLKNPIIYNKTTGYEMKINTTVYTSQTLVIDTENKTVKLNNTFLHNVKRLKDNWLVLQEGYNTILFSADSGANNCKVAVSFRNKRRGL